MNALAELEELLSGDYSENYWSNDLVLVARDLVAQLTDADWHTLQSSWSGQPATWQYRLADVISRGEPSKALPLLIPMIEADDDELSLTAADSLNAIATSVSISVLTAKAIDRLASLAGKSRLNERVISDLRARLVKVTAASPPHREPVGKQSLPSH